MKRGPHPSIIISNRNLNRGISCRIKKREKVFTLSLPKILSYGSQIFLHNYPCRVLQVHMIKRYQGPGVRVSPLLLVSSRAANVLVPSHCFSDGWHPESLPRSAVILWSGPAYSSSLLTYSGLLVPPIRRASSESFLRFPCLESLVPPSPPQTSSASWSQFKCHLFTEAFPDLPDKFQGSYYLLSNP